MIYCNLYDRYWSFGNQRMKVSEKIESYDEYLKMFTNYYSWVKWIKFGLCESCLIIDKINPDAGGYYFYDCLYEIKE